MSTAPLLPPAAVAVSMPATNAPAGPRHAWRGGLFDCFGGFPAARASLGSLRDAATCDSLRPQATAAPPTLGPAAL